MQYYYETSHVQQFNHVLTRQASVGLDRPWLNILINFSVIFYHIIAHSSAHYVWILINYASKSCQIYLLSCNTSMNTIDTIQLFICKVLHPHPKINWEWAIWHQSGRPGLKALFLSVPSWNFSFTTIWLCPSQTCFNWHRWTIFLVCIMTYRTRSGNFDGFSVMFHSVIGRSSAQYIWILINDTSK